MTCPGTLTLTCMSFYQDIIYFEVYDSSMHAFFAVRWGRLWHLHVSADTMLQVISVTKRQPLAVVRVEDKFRLLQIVVISN